MKSIHVLRKPCSEPTVAANVLRYGTGALNIDATRISAPDTAGKVWVRGGNQKGASLTTNCTGEHQYLMANPAGRWPANLILQHFDGCVQEGARNVRSSDRPGHGHKQSPVHVIGPAHRHSEVRHGNLDGTETVAAWACASGCPVAALDAQSLAGGMHGAGTSRPPGLSVMNPKYRGLFGLAGHKSNGVRFGDTGGASRFFKQVGGQDDR
jgi:hypothetical protein